MEVNFGGYPHRFTINLASSDSDFEVPTNIPAVPTQRILAMQRTPETWHFPDGPPPSRVDGMEVIEQRGSRSSPTASYATLGPVSVLADG